MASGCGSSETVTTSAQSQPARAPSLQTIARCLSKDGFRSGNALNPEEVTFAAPAKALISVLHFDDPREGRGIARGLETKPALGASSRVVYTVGNGTLVVAISNPSGDTAPRVFGCTSQGQVEKNSVRR
jgi:hypothetical protein